jgi:hypothetical protein
MPTWANKFIMEKGYLGDKPEDCKTDKDYGVFTFVIGGKDY